MQLDNRVWGDRSRQVKKLVLGLDILVAWIRMMKVETEKWMVSRFVFEVTLSELGNE